MEGKSKTNVEGVFLVLLGMVFLLGLFLISRSLVIGVNYSDICKNEYGEDYKYKVIEDFGRYCVELDYENLTMKNWVSFDWTNKEVKEICDVPKFFELKRWDNGICNN